LEVVQSGANVILTVHNTGPYVDQNYIDLLNSESNPKGDNDVSGVYLIKKVLNIFSIGTMTFFSDEIYRKLGWFKVEFILNNWNEETIAH
jgi:hypothetical protein